MSVWLDPPGCTDGLAEACRSDAAIIGAAIHEKRKALKILRDHGRGDCETARQLKAQIAGLRAQQKQHADGAKRLRADKPPVGSMANKARASRSMPPKGW